MVRVPRAAAAKAADSLISQPKQRRAKTTAPATKTKATAAAATKDTKTTKVVATPSDDVVVDSGTNPTAADYRPTKASAIGNSDEVPTSTEKEEDANDDSMVTAPHDAEDTAGVARQFDDDAVAACDDDDIPLKDMVNKKRPALTRRTSVAASKSPTKKQKVEKPTGEKEEDPAEASLTEASTNDDSEESDYYEKVAAESTKTTKKARQVREKLFAKIAPKTKASGAGANKKMAATTKRSAPTDAKGKKPRRVNPPRGDSKAQQSDDEISEPPAPPTPGSAVRRHTAKVSPPADWRAVAAIDY